MANTKRCGWLVAMMLEVALISVPALAQGGGVPGGPGASGATAGGAGAGASVFGGSAGSTALGATGGTSATGSGLTGGTPSTGGMTVGLPAGLVPMPQSGSGSAQAPGGSAAGQ
jgi:hypothetical protein